MTLESKPLKSLIRTNDGKEVINLEDFLSRNLKHPDYETEALRLSVTAIMRLLGIPDIGMSEAKRAAEWFRENGYRATHNKQVHRLALS